MLTQFLTYLSRRRWARLQPVLATSAAIGILLFADSAWAVSTSGSAYAKQLSPPSTNNPTTRNHSAGPSATSVSSNSRADSRGTTVDASHTTPITDSKAHAISSASATVSGGTVTKSATGNSWIEAGFNTKAHSWNAFATGTQLIAIGPTATVNYEIFIPATNNPLLPEDFHPQPFATDPVNMDRVRQTLFTDDTGLTTQPSFFDVFVDLDVNVQQGVLNDQLWQGSVSLTRAASGGLSQTGDFNALSIFQQVNQANRTGAIVPLDRAKPGVPNALLTGVPFELTMDLLVRTGNTSEPSLAEEITLEALAGNSGSFIAQFRLPEGYLLLVVPEPSSAMLALMSVAGLAAFRRRRHGKCRSEI